MVSLGQFNVPRIFQVSHEKAPDDSLVGGLRGPTADLP